MYPFNTLQVCYRHVEDVHKVWLKTICFDKYTTFLTQSIFGPLHVQYSQREAVIPRAFARCELLRVED